MGTATGGAATTFSVIPLPPTLTAISPATAVRSSVTGQTIPVTLIGTSLYSPSWAVTRSGVALSGLKTTSFTSATALISVAANAELGPREITLTTLGGTSAPLTFTVVLPVPVITRVDPAIAGLGATVNVT